jgi:hypothetical protein
MAAQAPPHRPLPVPWAPVAAALATLFTVALSGRVWHSTGLPAVDAWMLELLGAQSDERQLRLATEVASGCGPLPWPESWPRPSSPGGSFGGGARSPWPCWRLRPRWPPSGCSSCWWPAGRPARWSSSTRSGHMAVATALVLSLVLILRPAMARPRVKLSIGLSVALLVPLMAWARLVETAHLLTDVIGGVSTGVAVTLGTALPARPVSPGRTPRAPCPRSREGGRTAGRPRAPAARPRPPPSRSCRGR